MKVLFLVGSNSHTYRVYNSHHGKVMETVNVRFDESNGSQKEHLPNVIDEPPISDVIRQMAIGASSQLKKMHLSLPMMMLL
jgi:hypothetical protein